MFLSSRQAGYSNRQQGPKNLEFCRVLESDKCEVSGRYFVVGGQIAGCRHILTGLLKVIAVMTACIEVISEENFLHLRNVSQRTFCNSLSQCSDHPGHTSHQGLFPLCSNLFIPLFKKNHLPSELVKKTKK